MTNFKENHFYDFEHAAAALAYCDAFLTEGFLTSLANARHTGLCGINDCRVTADVDEAVTIVREFVAHLSGGAAISLNGDIIDEPCLADARRPVRAAVASLRRAVVAIAAAWEVGNVVDRAAGY